MFQPLLPMLFVKRILALELAPSRLATCSMLGAHIHGSIINARPQDAMANM